MYKRKANVENINNENTQTRSKSAKKFIVRRRRSIIFSGAVTWNALKLETKNIQIFDVFKFHQKKEMLTF